MFCLSNRDIDYLDVFLRLLLVDPGILDFVNNVESLVRPSEDGMLPVQPGSLFSCDEELGAIGIWTSVGHAHRVWLIMLQG